MLLAHVLDHAQIEAPRDVRLQVDPDERAVERILVRQKALALLGELRRIAHAKHLRWAWGGQRGVECQRTSALLTL